MNDSVAVKMMLTLIGNDLTRLRVYMAIGLPTYNKVLIAFSSIFRHSLLVNEI